MDTVRYNVVEVSFYIVSLYISDLPNVNKSTCDDGLGVWPGWLTVRIRIVITVRIRTAVMAYCSTVLVLVLVQYSYSG